MATDMAAIANSGPFKANEKNLEKMLEDFNMYDLSQVLDSVDRIFKFQPLVVNFCLCYGLTAGLSQWQNHLNNTQYIAFSTTDLTNDIEVHTII